MLKYLLVILKDKEKNSTHIQKGNLISYKLIKFYINLHIVFYFIKLILYIIV